MLLQQGRHPTALCDRGAGRGVPGEYAPSNFTDVDKRTEAEIDSLIRC